MGGRRPIGSGPQPCSLTIESPISDAWRLRVSTTGVSGVSLSLAAKFFPCVSICSPFSDRRQRKGGHAAGAACAHGRSEGQRRRSLRRSPAVEIVADGAQPSLQSHRSPNFQLRNRPRKCGDRRGIACGGRASREAEPSPVRCSCVARNLWQVEAGNHAGTTGFRAAEAAKEKAG